MDDWRSDTGVGPCAASFERSVLPAELGLETDSGEGEAAGLDESYCCRDIVVDYRGRNHAK